MVLPWLVMSVRGHLLPTALSRYHELCIVKLYMYIMIYRKTIKLYIMIYCNIDIIIMAAITCAPHNVVHLYVTDWLNSEKSPV